MWPSPVVHGIGGGSGGWEMLKAKTKDYDEAKQMGAGNGGQLNPQFVLWLMGWPLFWTSLEPMKESTWAAWLEAFQTGSDNSKPSETDKSPPNLSSQLDCLEG